MTEKWTPGPWASSDSVEDDMRISGPNGEGVVDGCGCCDPPYGVRDPEECAANRNLIAAAPDMAEALEDIGRQIDRDPYTTPDFTRAERALAKARGEEE